MKCNKVFSFESNVYRHYKTRSEKKVISSSGTEYFCTVCNKCFTKKFNLKRHEATHSSNKECYQCKNCHKEYNREDFYEKHVKACNHDPVVSSEFVSSFCSSDTLSTDVNSETIDIPIESVDFFLSTSSDSDALDSYSIVNNANTSRNYMKGMRSREKIEKILKGLTPVQRVHVLSREESPENMFCIAVGDYLENIYQTKCHSQFFKITNEIFGLFIQNNQFITFLAKVLGFSSGQLLTRLSAWADKNFIDARGNKKLSKEVQQQIYGCWKENSIVTADRRNGRDSKNQKSGIL